MTLFTNTLSTQKQKNRSLFLIALGVTIALLYVGKLFVVTLVVAITIVGWFERPSIWAELAVYVALGFLWALPFKRVFTGVGRADPDEPDNSEGGD